MVGPLKVEVSLTDQERIGGGEPLTQMICWTLKSSIGARVSDIHFEPFKDEYRIRRRIDGKLEPWAVYDVKHKDMLTYELKRQFNLPVTDIESPADGAAVYPEWGLQVRSSKAKCEYGEKIVVRLFHQEKSFTLEECGYTESSSQIFREAIRNKSGVVLLAGGTGSGKTTTLYSLVGELNRSLRNISTLEDPVECQIPGVNQFPVTGKQSFADGLRALLRQDPDVIMVGEIRDQETANLCVQAANTGHLVLSTIHANTAWGVFGRLEALGVSKALFADSVKLIAAQRLAPKLCLNCRKKNDVGYTRGSGCNHCRCGYYSMTPVPELLVPNNKSGFENQGACYFKSFKSTYLELATMGVVDTDGLEEFR